MAKNFYFVFLPLFEKYLFFKYEMIAHKNKVIGSSESYKKYTNSYVKFAFCKINSKKLNKS